MRREHKRVSVLGSELGKPDACDRQGQEGIVGEENRASVRNYESLFYFA